MLGTVEDEKTEGYFFFFWIWMKYDVLVKMVKLIQFMDIWEQNENSWNLRKRKVKTIFEYRK